MSDKESPVTETPTPTVSDDMLVIPVTVHDKVIGLLYADERFHAIPDDHLTQVGRAAGQAFERLLQR